MRGRSTTGCATGSRLRFPKVDVINSRESAVAICMEPPIQGRQGMGVMRRWLSFDFRIHIAMTARGAP